MGIRHSTAEEFSGLDVGRHFDLQGKIQEQAAEAEGVLYLAAGLYKLQPTLYPAAMASLIRAG